MNHPLSIPVVETTQVGDARRSAVTLAASLHFSEERRGVVAIVVTELATNLVRHAKGGEIILRPITAGDTLAVEVLASDRGPGIGNLSDALRDGFSTFGTPGTGLGAASRLSNAFDIFTSPQGTIVLSQISSGPAPLQAQKPEVGVICLPVASEVACGDAWSVRKTVDARTMILVADGLGHGIHAAAASHAAVELFEANVELDLPELVTVLHKGLRSTRGAAIAIVELNSGRNELRFVGVGNISGTLIIDGKTRSTVSHNGTVGAEVHRIKEFNYPWPNDGMLVLHSDGLRSQWNLDAYRGLRMRHPSIIGAVLYRDFRRDRDDVTVMVIKASQSQP